MQLTRNLEIMSSIVTQIMKKSWQYPNMTVRSSEVAARYSSVATVSCKHDSGRCGDIVREPLML